jgi:hypothetical protein
MSPTAEYGMPETEEFRDWQTSTCPEPLPILSEEQSAEEKAHTIEEDLVCDPVSLWVVELPSASRRDDITSAICGARELTRLGHDWDGEGSQGYSVNTWKRMRRFILRHAALTETCLRATLPPPSINPADHGSLDVFWQLKDRQLLINFPQEESEPITYYGQNKERTNTISGRTTERERRLDLAAWLIQKTK